MVHRQEKSESKKCNVTRERRQMHSGELHNMYFPFNTMTWLNRGA